MKHSFLVIAMSVLCLPVFPSMPGPLVAEIDCRDYFFPVDKFNRTVVYQYVCHERGYPKRQYLVMKTMRTGGRTFLISEKYDHRFAHKESREDELTSTGVVLRKLGTNRVRENEEMRWQISRSEPLRFTYAKAGPSEKHYKSETLRERRLTGNQAILEFNGTKYESLEFIDQFHVNFEDLDSRKKDYFSYGTMVYYARNLGLIGYHLSLPDGTHEQYRLEKILSSAAWEQIRSRRN